MAEAGQLSGRQQIIRSDLACHFPSRASVHLPLYCHAPIFKVAVKFVAAVAASGFQVKLFCASCKRRSQASRVTV